MAQQNTNTLQRALQHDTNLKSLENAIKQKNTNRLKLSLEFHSRIDDMFQYLLTAKKQDIQQNAVRVRQWKQELFAKHLQNLREAEREFERELEQTLHRLRFASFVQLSPSTIHQDVHRFPIPPLAPNQTTVVPLTRRRGTVRDKARELQKGHSHSAGTRAVVMDNHTVFHPLGQGPNGPNFNVQRRRNTVNGDGRTQSKGARAVQWRKYNESNSNSANFGKSGPKSGCESGGNLGFKSKTQRNGRDYFCCPHCHSEFGVESRFIAHVREHQNEKNFQCPACFVRFQRRKELVNHIETIHPQVLSRKMTT